MCIGIQAYDTASPLTKCSSIATVSPITSRTTPTLIEYDINPTEAFYWIWTDGEFPEPMLPSSEILHQAGYHSSVRINPFLSEWWVCRGRNMNIHVLNGFSSRLPNSIGLSTVLSTN